MAEHLASIFGTEKDRVNCPFYFKIGACRHGDRCSRLHNRPTISPTILMSNMYQRPDMTTPGGEPDKTMDPKKVQEHFEDFYEDLFEELSKYGEIDSLNVCDNLADHMVGNVYVNFREEEQAAAALRALTGRFYAGRPIMVDFSPVTDFREATCRQYEENTCNRGGYCNFMHLRKINRDLRRKLFGDQPPPGRRRSRSRSPPPFPGGRGGFRGGRGGGFGRFGRGRGPGRFYDDRRFDDRRFDERRGGPYDRPGPGRRSRSRSRSPEREGSAERRAKIERWNREREERDNPPPPPGGVAASHPGVPPFAAGMGPGALNPAGAIAPPGAYGSGGAHPGYGEPDGGRYGAPPAPPYAGGGGSFARGDRREYAPPPPPADDRRGEQGGEGRRDLGGPYGRRGEGEADERRAGYGSSEQWQERSQY